MLLAKQHSLGSMIGNVPLSTDLDSSSHPNTVSINTQRLLLLRAVLLTMRASRHSSALDKHENDFHMYRMGAG
jgi:hypothetical protein